MPDRVVSDHFMGQLFIHGRDIVRPAALWCFGPIAVLNGCMPPRESEGRELGRRQ